jgi:hypothetical protein
VLGIYFTVKEISAKLIKNNVTSKITVEINGYSDTVEAALRRVMSANPSSDIFVIDKSGSEETENILSRLSRDNQCIHIEKQASAE